MRWLADHRDQVSSAKARQIVQAIEQAFSLRDDYETLFAREKIAWERQSGWMGRLKYRLAEWFPRELPATSIRDEYLTSSASLRALQTVYAIRLFQTDWQRLPQSLAELTPNYLPAVPLDHFSERPLVYRPTEDEFTLHSVGWDRLDDGGKFDEVNYHRHAGFDLDLSWGSRRPGQ